MTQPQQPQQPSIRVVANGTPCSAPAGSTIPDLVRQLGLHPDRVIVERNGQALTRADAAATQLAEGDRLEIVRIVAGG